MENGEEKGGDVKVTFFPGPDFLKLRLVVGGVAANDLGFRDSAGGTVLSVWGPGCGSGCGVSLGASVESTGASTGSAGGASGFWMLTGWETGVIFCPQFGQNAAFSGSCAPQL